MDVDKAVLGTVSLQTPHAADYEHNFHLSNSQTETYDLSNETEQKIYEIAKRLVEPIQQELGSVKIRLNELETREEEHIIIMQENKKLKEKILNLENISKKNNIKFIGVREQRGESKFDRKRTILGILKQSGIHLHHKAIESAERVGPQKNRNRPIVAKLFHGEEREYVLTRSAHIYRCTGIKTEEDFPIEIEKNRRVLKPILNKAAYTTVNGRCKYQASLHVDKLNINGKTYSIDTIKELPEDIHPTTVFTPSKNGITAFFGGQSPFSNHHIAPQTVDNQTFNCNEQYYMFKKAKTFNDHKTASQILREKDPVEQKKLGSNVAGFNRTVWQSRCLDVMEEGLKAKFD